MKYRIKQEGELFYAQKKGRFSFSWENLINWELIFHYNLPPPIFYDRSNTIFHSYESALRAIEEDKKRHNKNIIHNL
jgi:hypothetical protein